MNKSNAFASLKSLAVSGCALFVWGMTPLLLTSTLTSCEKLEELLGGGEEEGDEGLDEGSSGNNNGVATNDGAAPYFQLESTEIKLPAIASEELLVRCQTNIMSMHYVLEKFKKFETGETQNPEEYSFILQEPASTFHYETFFQYHTNYAAEKQTDNLLIYATDKDSLLATIPIEQEAGAYVSVTEHQADVNKITLKLEGHNGAQFYSAYCTTEEIPLYEIIERYKHGETLPFDHTLGLDSDPTITFTGLTEATQYHIYLQGGASFSDMCGLTSYSVTTAMRGKEDALILEYALTALNNRTVYLPFEGKVKGVIDWGDGVVETINEDYVSSATLAHTYTEGNQTSASVAFKGTLESLVTNSTPNGEMVKNSLTGISQWGYPELKTVQLKDVVSLTHLAADTKGALSGITDFTSCFEGCSNLTSLPEGLFAMAANAKTFDYAFKDCEKLASLPADLFAHNPNARNFNGTFSRCKGLESLPENLFAQNPAYSLTDVFSGCSNLKEIPAGLFKHNTELGHLVGAFAYCSSLTTLPEGLFANAKYIQSVSEITSSYEGRGIFTGCTSLTHIPQDLFATMTKLTNLSGVFKDCESLREIPEGLFDHCTQVSTMWHTFYGCKSLQRIPTGLFDSLRRIQSTYRLFQGCQSLTGESPYTLINGVKVHLYERQNYPTEFTKITNHTGTYGNCKGLSDYKSIPKDWN